MAKEHKIEQTESRTIRAMRELFPRADIDNYVDRASQALSDRPALTLATAAGVGFLLGSTMFTKVGRLVFIGALGLGIQALRRRGQAEKERSTTTH